jgi:hypothetical protein
MVAMGEFMDSHRYRRSVWQCADANSNSDSDADTYSNANSHANSHAGRRVAE